MAVRSWFSRRPTRYHQRRFAFEIRRARHDGFFKAAIVVATLAALAGAMGGTSTGRYWIGSLSLRLRWLSMAAFGLEPPREEVEALWRLKRQRGMEGVRSAFASAFARAEPAFQRLLRVSGMAPDEALIRWGNYDQTLVLSARVFEPDDSGRSYRLRPNTRSVWLRSITVPKGFVGHFLFLVPDTAEVRGALEGTGAIVVPESVQTTNSWGCRGREPDRSAPVRGLVLGDSFMQGYLVGDDATPPAQLEVRLAEVLGRPVSILNTGHLGYSPEQYLATLRTYFDRFRPQFVVLSVFANDFGDGLDLIERGQGDFAEGAYWLGEIEQFCRSHQVPCLMVPAPSVEQVTGRRRVGNYPGQVANLFTMSGIYYCDPTEAFVDEHLRLVGESASEGHRLQTSPLFNGHYGDGHFSARGASVWSRLVGRRIALLSRQSSGVFLQAGAGGGG